jgi:SHS2 domain-containing protein
VETPFEILEHPADVGFRAWGRTREELFENAALALFSLGCELAAVEEKETRTIQVTGADLEMVLYAWLAELLAVSEGERIVFRRAVVAFDGARGLRGTAYGEALDHCRHHSGTQIKAVTFHQLYVEESDDGWCAQVFLDL